jgi:hypothetical protein
VTPRRVGPVPDGIGPLQDSTRQARDEDTHALLDRGSRGTPPLHRTPSEVQYAGRWYRIPLEEMVQVGGLEGK